MTDAGGAQLIVLRVIITIGEYKESLNLTLKDMYLLLHTTYGHSVLWLMLLSPTERHRSTYLDGSYIASPGRILCRYSQGRWIHSVKTDFRHFDPFVDRSSQSPCGLKLSLQFAIALTNPL